MNEQVDASLMIEKGQVVVVDYRLIDQSGDCLEQSDEASPMVYLHGHNNLMPGLERELQGKQQGDQLAVTLPPEQTYGLRREDAVERIPIKYLIKPRKKLTPGMRVQVNTKQGLEMQRWLRRVGLMRMWMVIIPSLAKPLPSSCR